MVLHEFVTANREEIIERCRAKISSRPAPLATDVELEYGVPLFLDQLADILRAALTPSAAMTTAATRHGDELLRAGFTVAQVVHDYGGICQAITELAIETSAPITTDEFKTLNLCLDEAIAEAVTEYARLRDYAGTERLGRVAHELRNLLNAASLSYEVLKKGSVGIGGSTGRVLGRSLLGLRNLIDLELTEVRLGAGVSHREPVVVCRFIEDIEVAATLEAGARGLKLAVSSVASDLVVHVDRQILASVVSNLLQNAVKFTRPGGRIALRVRATVSRVMIDVEDQCGGLPAGRADDLFRPFAQRAADRSGLGLGLSVAHRGAQANDGEIHVENLPGVGCVFTVDLPRSALPPAG